MAWLIRRDEMLASTILHSPLHVGTSLDGVFTFERWITFSDTRNDPLSNLLAIFLLFI
jgi:hypothetical protein